MQILKAKFIISSDENFTIYKDKCLAFDEKILSIGEENDLKQNYQNAEFYDFGNAIITPAFINTHVHLEFSANKTSLRYGDFIAWLGSIVSKKLPINDNFMQKGIDEMLKSGVGTIGEISSFGADLAVLANSPFRVVFFNELLGSNPNNIQENFDKFLSRFAASKKYENPKFKAAISIHSPYSIHPNLATLGINFAKENKLLISTHFLESKAEKLWLCKAKGGFKNHLKNFIPKPKPVFTPQSFLSLFAGLKTLFTHCVWADFKDFDPEFHSITHCANSNRLLGTKALNLKKLLKSKIPLNIGTDGLSSNTSLNFLNELRAGLLTHSKIELNLLAKILFTASTSGGAKALGLENGIIKKGKLADIAVFDGFDDIDENSLLTQLLLHTKEAKSLFIGGKKVF
ncbi:MAG: metal-dependent hydrolase [Campylobacter sp.]|nr:metal-dependent hydrolase [Campylobacter sp.]